MRVWDSLAWGNARRGLGASFLWTLGKASTAQHAFELSCQSSSQFFTLVAWILETELTHI